MIGREHFKTCVRAYFPDHDFSWLDRWPVDYVTCTNLNGLANMTDDPYDEHTLLHILRPYTSKRLYDPRTLTFVGEPFILGRSDYCLDFDIVFVLKDISISTYARQFFHAFD